jgi:C4-dicarboxylate transporter DctM subunit
LRANGSDQVSPDRFRRSSIAARSGRLLALSTGAFLPESQRGRLETAQSFVTVAVTAALAWAGLELFLVDLRFGDVATWQIPVWAFTAVVPIGFAAIALRLAHRASASWTGRLIAGCGCLVPLALSLLPSSLAASLVWPFGLVLFVGMLLGMPIYAVLGGLALVLFWQEGTPITAVPGEAYRMATSPMLPALPLFAMAGYVLAAGGSSKRLLRLFASAVGWMPGGLAIVVTLVLAFFTPLTGASGITILAMGGLLLPMLIADGYRESNALGLVTVSGSIGVLFPPSLPVILYAYYAETDLGDLFLAGVVPGILLVVAVAAWSAWRGIAGGATRTAFDGRALVAAFWQAKWEVLLPVVILAGIFGGFATLVEAAALTVLYAVVLECFVFREITWRKVAEVAHESATTIGAFMIILSVALGLTNYLVIAQIPAQIVESMRSVVESPYVFLLLLNVFLVVVGALMDIYSAIIVVVPLVAPLAAAYGIHPVHLGIIFLANMELGYLVPPMGENLFLSAQRFDKPLAELYRDVLPFVLIIAIVVLVITYVPAFTMWALAPLPD